MLNLKPLRTRCFVDQDGHIWSIDSNGQSNYPADIEIEDDTVSILGVREGDQREIVDEFQLWPSLTSLALALEHSIPESPDGSVNLYQAVAGEHKRIESFKNSWEANNLKEPSHYPMELPAENSGLWQEQIHEHST